jgi:glycosyltransferase involved in cell wall biosynthesis
LEKKFWIDWYLLKKSIFDKKSIFIIGGWHDVTIWLCIISLIIFGKKYFFWTDTPNLNSKRILLKTIFRNILLHIGYSKVSSILCTGRPAIQIFIKNGVRKEKLINFPYWVDIPILKPSKQMSLPKGIIRFVSSGRLINELKGHDLAIKSLALSIQQTGLSNFEYLIAGTGPDAAILKNLAEGQGIGKSIRFLGWVEPSDLANIFDKSDILIHPSPVHEPYGVAVLEAMAAGMVVLASDITYSALDRINNGINGFIHKAGDIIELSAQISNLLKNPGIMSPIKSAARNTAEDWPVGRGIRTIKEIIS